MNRRCQTIATKPKKSGLSPARWRNGGLSLAVSPALESLKKNLLEQELAGAEEPELRQRLLRAGEESAAVAWTTPFPLLALPELLAEKGREAREYYHRQQTIKNRTAPRLSFAA